MVTLLRNNHPSKTITVSHLELVPWFLRFFFHTLHIETFPSEAEVLINGTVMAPGDETSTWSSFYMYMYILVAI